MNKFGSKNHRKIPNNILIFVSIKILRGLAQSDAIAASFVPNTPRRDPQASRNRDELAANGASLDEYLQGDIDVAEWQARELRQRLQHQQQDRQQQAPPLFTNNDNFGGGADFGHQRQRWRRRRRKIGRVGFKF
jgi:hypothetical protein